GCSREFWFAVRPGGVFRVPASRRYPTVGGLAWPPASNGPASAPVGGVSPMNRSVRVCFVLVGALLVGLPACTGGPRTFPVKGTVMYAGKPVPKGTVLFTPVNGGAPATRAINQGGALRLTPHQPRGRPRHWEDP